MPAMLNLELDAELGADIAKQVDLKLEPESVVGYVLLSNIYAAACNRHLCENVSKMWEHEDAWRMFNMIATLRCGHLEILGHVKCRQGQKALELF